MEVKVFDALIGKTFESIKRNGYYSEDATFEEV